MVDATASKIEKVKSGEMTLQEFLDSQEHEVNLRRQTLELWMFVPVGENGEVLKGKPLSPAPDSEWIRWENEQEQFFKARSRCLFEGFEVVDTSKDDDGIPMVVKNKDCYAAYFEDGVWNLKRNETIESLIPYNLTLTENALR